MVWDQESEFHGDVTIWYERVFSDWGDENDLIWKETLRSVKRDENLILRPSVDKPIVSFPIPLNPIIPNQRNDKVRLDFHEIADSAFFSFPS